MLGSLVDLEAWLNMPQEFKLVLSVSPDSRLISNGVRISDGPNLNFSVTQFTHQQKYNAEQQTYARRIRDANAQQVYPSMERENPIPYEIIIKGDLRPELEYTPLPDTTVHPMVTKQNKFFLYIFFFFILFYFILISLVLLLIIYLVTSINNKFVFLTKHWYLLKNLCCV